MLVEITETCRQTENLNYPCEHLTVGFISEEQLQALAGRPDCICRSPRKGNP